MNTRKKTVGEIVSGRPTYVMSGGASVRDAARYMTACQVGAVPVVGDGGRLLGIFSERDLMTRAVAQGLDPATTTVSDVMTRRVAVLGEDNTYEDALAVMNALHIRHLPVMIQQKVVGCISLRELKEAEVEVKDREIKFLDDYIERIERAL